MDVITFAEICKPLVVYRFKCMALFHCPTQRHMIKQAFYANDCDYLIIIVLHVFLVLRRKVVWGQLF